MAVVLIILVLVLGVPLLSHALLLRENACSGHLPDIRQLCGGRLVLPVLRAAWNSVWSMALVLATYPLGWLPQARPRPCPQSGLPPVLLVHGLYHNTSAWVLFRRRLRRAGFCDVRCYGYPSFWRGFAAIVDGLARELRTAAQESPTGTVLLVGHSLGGLVIRSACADADLHGMISGIVTLGTPHQGSRLAGLLALGQLGRGLQSAGSVLEAVRALPVCPGPALSLYTPTDNMVLPLSGLTLEQRERQAGWEEACLPPMSHIGMLFDRRTAELCVEYLLRCAKAPASPQASA